MPKEMSMYNYDDNGALSITHFAPDTVTTACGTYILDGRSAWTQEPGSVEGCPCYNLGYTRAKQEMADSQPTTGADDEA